MRTAPSGPAARHFHLSPLAVAIAAALAPLPAAAYTVSSAADSGPGTLRQAFIDANANCTTFTNPTISFAIPVAPFQIDLASPLPALNCSVPWNPAINGLSQPAVQINATAITTGCVIEFDPFAYGGTLTAQGMTIHSYNASVRALCGQELVAVGNQLTGSGIGLFAWQGLDARGNVINGLGAGTGIAGYGILVNIGGPSPADRNIIHNAFDAIYIGYAGSVNIVGNYIGTDVSGTNPSPNAYGIYLESNVSASVTDNVISGNLNNAIEVFDQDDLLVSGNKIGVGSSGGVLQNGGSGVHIDYTCCGMPVMMMAKGGEGRHAGRLMGTHARAIAKPSRPSIALTKSAQAANVLITGNTIANNFNSGVNVNYGGGINISQNSIYNNTPKNIHLNAYGGPANNLQAYPLITSVVHSGGSTNIGYVFSSAPSSSYELEFYTNAALGIPAGQSYVGTITLTTDAYGGAFGTATLGGTLSNVSALGRNVVSKDTSEFSSIVAVTPTPAVSLSSSSINFGNVPIGMTAAGGMVTFTSQGTAPWVVAAQGSPSCYGGPICYGGAEFSCYGGCVPGTPYNNGQSCNLSASFSPTMLGSQSVTVQVCDNTTGSPHTITISGNGITPPAPAVSMSATSLNFGDVAVGSSSTPQSVSFTSSGTAPWLISAAGSPSCYGGPICYGGPFSCYGGCVPGTPYNPGQSCSLSSTFAPTAPGPYSVNVQYCDNATGSPRTVTLTGNGIIPGAPAVSASTSALNFGEVVLGTSSPTLTATFTSSGLQPWIIASQGSPTCYGGPICYGGSFTCATTCSPSSAYSSGQSCKIDAFFTPSALGPQSVTVQFCDNAPGSPRSLVLSAIAVTPPAVTLSPSAHDFGSVPVGSTATPFSFNVSNPGTSPLFIGPVTVTPPFSLASTTCPPSLGPSGSCDAIVGFKPTADGYVSGALGVSGFPSVTATLVGRGLTSAQLVLPTAIEFPSYTLGQPALTREVTLRNSGQLPLTIASLAATSPFTLAHNCPTTPMPPDASCVATLGFSTPTLGNFAGSFTVVSDAAGGTQVVPIRASSQPRPAPVLSVSPLEVGFGGRGVGAISPAQTVTIRNIGGALALVDSLVTSADFTVLGHNCATIAPLAECAASVAMQASSFGLRVGTLTIRSNAENGPQTVLLSGTGCRPPGISAGRLGASGGGC